MTNLKPRQCVKLKMEAFLRGECNKIKWKSNKIKDFKHLDAKYDKIITALFVNKKQQQCVKLHVWEEKSINGRNNQI